MKNIQKILAARRAELKLSDVQVAQLSGLTIHQCSDLEAYEHEFWELISVAEARKVCKVLQLEMKDLLPHASADTAGFEHPTDIPALVKDARERLELTIDEVAEAIGYEAWVIERIESVPDFLETMCLSAVMSLAKILNLFHGLLIQ